MTKHILTILTDPLPIGRDFLPETARRIARGMKYTFKKRSYSSHSRFRGHFAVTRSLVEGLKKNGVDFNYNPNQLSELADTVVVLAGIRTLRQTIFLKKQGKISRLFAGPNIVHFSTDFDSILASSEVNSVITPCDWVTEHYTLDNPSLQGRIFSWPAGVDAAFWAPKPSIKPCRVLIFEKQNKGLVGPVEPYAEYLRGIGWKVDILRYGSFRHQDYRDLLQQSCLMVGFANGSESQGIAWAEAWAADVPTMLWQNTQQIFHGRLLHVSTAPYLCEQNGLFFDDLEHFKQQFAFWQDNRVQFSPRRWLLENMSDEVCARRLYDKVMSC